MSGAAPTASRLRRLALRHDAGSARAGSAQAAEALAVVPAVADQQRCDLCAAPLPAGHRHLLDVQSDAITCACRACGLLFDRRSAGGGHYRLLPDRRIRLPWLDLDPALWAALGVPVDLAFFVQGGDGRGVSARYPSPLGLTRAPVPLTVWQAVVARNPALAELAEDTEALLANRSGAVHEHWLVPLSDCYRLAAVVREHWQGFAGGPEVRQRVNEFFAGLATNLEEQR